MKLFWTLFVLMAFMIGIGQKVAIWVGAVFFWFMAILGAIPSLV